MIYHHQNIRD